MRKNGTFFRKLWAIGYGSALTVFSVYALLDTFVISEVYTVVEKADSSEAAVDDYTYTDVASESGDSAEQTETTYEDDHIKISIDTYRECDTDIYVADIQVDDPKYLGTAFANNAYGRNVTQKTSEIAQSAGAILAVNGDYYGTRESGYVIRDGELYRDSPSEGQEDLVIYRDGSFGIISEDEVSAEELIADGAYQVFSFGPALVTDGELSVSEGEEVGRAMASNPRTAIGILGEGHYVFVVSDGRTEESEGLSLAELGQFMQETLKVETAYNLDGGGSSTMVFGGKIVNNPTGGGHGSSGGERAVSDIIYIGK